MSAVERFLRLACVMALAVGVLAVLPRTAQAQSAPAGGLEPLTIVTSSGRHAFQVEVMRTPDQRAKGLMFRNYMPPDRGMLFDFKTPREVAFWMKNTLIPLDIIYIRADGTVLSIARNTTPLSEAPIPSGGPIVGVLELAGGRAGEIGLMPGDRIEHRIFKRD